MGSTAMGAQAPRRGQAHEGPWFGVGVGASNNDLECTGCTSTSTSDRWEGGTGPGGFLAAGYALSQQLLLGVEANAGGTGGEDANASIFQYLVVAQYFPSASGGLRLNAGLGRAVYDLSRTGGSVSATGYAYRVGAAYDFVMRNRFALAPYVNIARTTVGQGSLEANGNAGPVTRLENSMVTQIGLALYRY